MMMTDIKPPSNKDGTPLPESDSKVKKFYALKEQRKQLLESLKRPEVGLHIRMYVNSNMCTHHHIDFDLDALERKEIAILF